MKRAVIRGVSFGMRDFPDKQPGLWFGVYYAENENIGALMAYTWEESKQFLIEHQIDDIMKLNGYPCFIQEDGNRITFVKLIH